MVGCLFQKNPGACETFEHRCFVTYFLNFVEKNIHDSDLQNKNKVEVTSVGEMILKGTTVQGGRLKRRLLFVWGEMGAPINGLVNG